MGQSLDWVGMLVGIKLARASALRNVFGRNGGGTNLPLADMQKFVGREPKLGAVARSSKMRAGSKFKTKEADC